MIQAIEIGIGEKLLNEFPFLEQKCSKRDISGLDFFLEIHQNHNKS